MAVVEIAPSVIVLEPRVTLKPGTAGLRVAVSVEPVSLSPVTAMSFVASTPLAVATTVAPLAEIEGPVD